MNLSRSLELNKQMVNYIRMIEDKLKIKFSDIKAKKCDNSYTERDKIKELEKYIKYGSKLPEFYQDIDELQKNVA